MQPGKDGIAAAAIVNMMMEGRMPFNETQFVNAMESLDQLLLLCEAHHARATGDRQVDVDEDSGPDSVPEPT